MMCIRYVGHDRLGCMAKLLTNLIHDIGARRPMAERSATEAVRVPDVISLLRSARSIHIGTFHPCPRLVK